MNRFLKWLKRDTPQQSIASDADQDNVYADVRSDQIKKMRTVPNLHLPGLEQTKLTVVFLAPAD
jgi:hypothetical protein